MPARGYVPGRVDSAVMSDTTLTAGPFSYSKAYPTFRTFGADSAATRTRLGGVGFIHHLKHDPGASALIGQKLFQYRPAGLIHQLGVFRSGE